MDITISEELPWNSHCKVYYPTVFKNRGLSLPPKINVHCLYIMNVVLGSRSTAKNLPVAAVCVHIVVRGADNINLHADRIEFENGLRCYQRGHENNFCASCK